MIPAALAHPACLAIPVPADDRFFNGGGPGPGPGRSALDLDRQKPATTTTKKTTTTPKTTTTKKTTTTPKTTTTTKTTTTPKTTTTTKTTTNPKTTPAPKTTRAPKTAQTCMSFVRSIAGPRINCSLGYADQLNAITHWMDGSNIYGSTNATMNALRSFTGGLLRMTNDTVNKRTLLPVTTPCAKGGCFMSGKQLAIYRFTDWCRKCLLLHFYWRFIVWIIIRWFEIDRTAAIGCDAHDLVSLLLNNLFIFLCNYIFIFIFRRAREHNRVAKVLAGLNPTWSDETIYQEVQYRVLLNYCYTDEDLDDFVCNRQEESLEQRCNTSLTWSGSPPF